ncbi:MAG: SUMF1/EgtB/PvdO family nonheme iron enzyme [Planctomycetia bacterium]|nr:SUMF1/EgtB/PvdO family nonheme iron enzyme [Planctomycetia bacterium]
MKPCKRFFRSRLNGRRLTAFGCRFFTAAAFVLVHGAIQLSLAAEPPATPNSDLEARFVAADLNADGMLTGKERENFPDYGDADGDDVLTRDEFLAMHERERRMLAEVVREREDDEAFRVRDISEDGILTGTEKKGVEKYDANGDGRIVLDEFRAGRAMEPAALKPANFAALSEETLGDTEALDAMKQKDLQRYLQLDGNEDGRLSGSEMLGLETFDVDANGRVTREEFLIGSALERKKSASKPSEESELVSRFDAGKVWIALGGVTQYPDRKLPCGTPDIHLMEATVAKLGLGKTKIDVLVSADDDKDEDNHPTKTILPILYSNRSKRAVEQDTAIFYFSGRVTTFDGRGYLCPLDFDAEQPAQTGVSIEDVIKSIGKFKTRRKLLLLEGFTYAEQPTNAEGPLGASFEKPLTYAPGITTILSCRSGEVPAESAARTYGTFTLALAAAWSGKADFNLDGIVDDDELYAYLKLAVPYSAQRIAPGTEQTPRRISGPGPTGSFGVLRVKQAGPHAADVAKDLGLSEGEMVNSIGMKFVRLSMDKSYVSGSPDEEPTRRDDERLQPVQSSRPFFLGSYEVTQAEFLKVMGKNPALFSPAAGYTDRHPVEQVSWNEAIDFCVRLNKLPVEIAAGRFYRLPTECEWEFACTGGELKPFHCGNQITSEQANIRGDRPYADSPLSASLGRTQPVGSYAPNAQGLFDMHGNVSEWCLDWYDPQRFAYAAQNLVAKDYAGPKEGRERSARGGDYTSDVGFCRRAARRSFAPDYRYKALGFRVLCEVKDAPGEEPKTQ